MAEQYFSEDISSAPAKKSLASVSSPVLACSTFTSIVGSGALGSAPNTSAALSSSFARHCVIRFGWTLNCCASSADVLPENSSDLR